MASNEDIKINFNFIMHAILATITVTVTECELVMYNVMYTQNFIIMPRDLEILQIELLL